MRCYDQSIHGSYQEYRLDLSASTLAATTNLGFREAKEIVLDRFFQAQNRKGYPGSELKEATLYLHLREKARRGHERAFHLNGHKIEDLRLMERDQIALSKFLGEWLDKFRWAAVEDDELNAAIAAMWVRHDAEIAAQAPAMRGESA